MRKSKRNIRVKKYATVFLFFILFLSILLVDPCAGISLRIQDLLYQIPGDPFEQMYILPAAQLYRDDSAMRVDLAQVVRILNADEKNRPAVIGIDVQLYGRSDPESDAILSQVLLDGKNIVLTSMLRFDYRLVQRRGRLIAENMRADGQFRAVPPMDTVLSGYSNLAEDSDGRVRHGLLYEEYGAETAYAFAYQIYRRYMQPQGDVRLPPLNRDGMWFVDYRGTPEAFYRDVDWNDLLRGGMPPQAWRDCIILLSPHPDMQALSATPLGRQNSTSITANLVQSLLQPHRKYEVPLFLQALIIFTLVWMCARLNRLGKRIPIFTAGLSWLLWPMLCMLLYHMGNLVLDLFYLPLFLTILCGYYFASEWITMAYRRVAAWAVLRRYLPREMRMRLFREDVSPDKPEKRNIAVLFVDIRGFTPLSESLAPSQLAQVLKEYLTLTSGAILQNGGTLDKFIGDATMGFFNAPLYQEDYIYHAVKAAMEIVQGGQKIREAVFERFGRNIYFGVGVHCGQALVGQIGPDYRKDYTAVGDTVNTAARLESSAKSGEVLVSMRVCEALKGRLEASFVGERQIKGKSRPMMLYRVDALHDAPRTVQEEQTVSEAEAPDAPVDEPDA